ncbi:MAG TPA: endolytic transglycosylase MltG [Ruminococcaceae bacterium]|nr:endolytic transglycosylase MltG [Oscillospiraceae bacterium]
MIKRIIALMLVAVSLLSLACCKKDDDVYVTEPESQSTETNTESTQSGTSADTVKITFPEGYTLLKMAWSLEENGVCGTNDFLAAVDSYDLSSKSILSSIKEKDKICFLLEGYLFPATYTFQKNSEPKAVIDKMVSALEARFDQSMKDRAAELGYSVHEILTIASIIEKEAKTAEQRTLVSSTIHNRLKKGMRLEYDVTVKYCTGVIEVQYPDKIDYYKYLYNGNRVDGMIAGPICNPSLESINAALYPDNTDYVFFVIDTEPPYNSAFTASYDEHLKNVQKWKNGEL